MVPGLGFTEFLVLALLALIVVGPRELPVMLRKLGGVVRQARGMAREFQRSFDDLGREMELDELRKDIAALKRGEIGELGDIKRDFDALGRDLHGETRLDLDDDAPPKLQPYPPPDDNAAAPAADAAEPRDDADDGRSPQPVRAVSGER